MKATGMETTQKQNLSRKSRGTLTGSGLDLENKIFSASGRGRTFFLTFLFMELIDPVPGVLSVAACLQHPSKPAILSTAILKLSGLTLNFGLMEMRFPWREYGKLSLVVPT
jgi:hypothetical protein